MQRLDKVEIDCERYFPRELQKELDIIQGNFYICLGYIGIMDVFVIVNESGRVVEIPSPYIIEEDLDG